MYDLNATCPFCDKKLGHTTVVEGKHKPKNGDASLCLTCGEWAVFDFSLPEQMRKPTFEEYQDFVADEQMSAMRMAWLTVDKGTKTG